MGCPGCLPPCHRKRRPIHQPPSSQIRRPIHHIKRPSLVALGLWVTPPNLLRLSPPRCASFYSQTANRPTNNSNGRDDAPLVPLLLMFITWTANVPAILKKGQNEQQTLIHRHHQKSSGIRQYCRHITT